MKINRIYGADFYGVDDAVSLLKSSVTILTFSRKMESILSNLVENNIVLTQEEAEDLIIDLEQFLDINISSIEQFLEYKYAFYYDLNKRLNDFMRAYNETISVIRSLSELFISPTREETLILVDTLQTILCNLSIFTYRQFRVDNGFDFSLQVYSNRFSLDMEYVYSQFDNMLIDSKRFNKVSTIFDEYTQEKKEAFHEIVGDDFLDYDLLESDMIDNVLADKWDLERLYDEISLKVKKETPDGKED